MVNTRRVRPQAEAQSEALSWRIRPQLQAPGSNRAAARAGQGGCRQAAGPNDLAAPAHPCATRHRDILTNGRNASSACSPCPRAPSLDAAHQFTLSTSRPVLIAAATRNRH
jgi:hypothetical protein